IQTKSWMLCLSTQMFNGLHSLVILIALDTCLMVTDQTLQMYCLGLLQNSASNHFLWIYPREMGETTMIDWSLNLFRWQDGRQHSGYQKMLLAGFPSLFDLYLLKYPPGSYVPRHHDPLTGSLHYRFN